MSDYLVWFLVGAGFIVLELQLPGFILFFFGLGAWFVAVAAYAFEPSLNQQLLLFSATSVISLVGLRTYLRRAFHGYMAQEKTDDAMDEDEAAGAVATVVEAIGPEAPGRIDYRGSTWTAHADCAIAAGEKVRILAQTAEGSRAFNVSKLEDSCP